MKNPPATQEESEQLHREALNATEGATGVTARTPIYNHPTLELDSTMDFGKHKLCTLTYVINNHYGYIEWMLDNTEREISEEAYLYISHLKEEGKI
jgi:hypothetical protein